MKRPRMVASTSAASSPTGMGTKRPAMTMTTAATRSGDHDVEPDSIMTAAGGGSGSVHVRVPGDPEARERSRRPTGAGSPPALTTGQDRSPTKDRAHFHIITTKMPAHPDENTSAGTVSGFVHSTLRTHPFFSVRMSWSCLRATPVATRWSRGPRLEGLLFGLVKIAQPVVQLRVLELRPEAVGIERRPPRARPSTCPRRSSSHTPCRGRSRRSADAVRPGTLLRASAMWPRSPPAGRVRVPPGHEGAAPPGG